MTSVAAAAKAPRQKPRCTFHVARRTMRAWMGAHKSRPDSMLLGRPAALAMRARSSATASRHPAHCARCASTSPRVSAVSVPSTYSFSRVSHSLHMICSTPLATSGARGTVVPSTVPPAPPSAARSRDDGPLPRRAARTLPAPPAATSRWRAPDPTPPPPYSTRPPVAPTPPDRPSRTRAARAAPRPPGARARERPPQTPPPRRRTRRVHRSLPRRRIVRREHAQRAPPPGPLAQEHHVHGEPVQPGRECALAPEAREPLPRPHERVLRELFGAHRIGREAQTQRIHPTHLRPVQLLERGLVALLRTLDEIARVRLHRVARAAVRHTARMPLGWWLVEGGAGGRRGGWAGA